MGFKKGWREYKKSKRKPRRIRSKVKRVARRIRRRAKPKGGKKMGRSFLSTQTLMRFVRLGALAAPAIGVAMNASLSQRQKIEHAIRKYTGFNMHDGKFDFRNLAEGWLPYLGSVLVTYGIPKIAGILRRI